MGVATVIWNVVMKELKSPEDTSLPYSSHTCKSICTLTDLLNFVFCFERCSSFP